MTIRQRMLTLSLIGVFFMLLVGGIGYGAIARLDAEGQALIRTGSALREQMEADMMHDALRADVYRALLAASQQRAGEQAAIKADTADHVKAFRSAMASLKSTSLSAEVDAAIVRTQTSLEAYINQATQMVDIAFSDAAGAAARMDAFSASFKALEGEMSTLSDQIEAISTATQAESETAASTVRIMLLGAVVVAAAVLLGINLQVARSITVPLARAVEVTRSVASGDLASHIDPGSRDETGQLINALRQMSGDLAGVVGQVRDSAGSIALGSAEIANGNADLSHRTEEQAGNLQETASAMEELTATVRANAETARRATDLAISASTVASEGGDAVGAVVQTMSAISTSSRRIAEILGVIDSIAFQTNILALNAAVEAARAGEHGRGFAVVASEVRTLATRSAGAAREIKTLIGESVVNVENGTRQVDAAGETMRRIVDEVRSVSALIRQISAASDEQSQGLGQVNEAVTQLDRMTQQNAALVEQSAAAAESLKQQAERLNAVVAQFRLG
ncbi:methyl-accepting chemotaxis protein [Roseateles amylovorans]|uniref:methyl-accepting chemotaxis protein n=1 Tax=Roseateles amylovorans TaxID=2978473 RepID=UPI0025B6FE6D|nr:methyl-accepting chemotaxis protein [Roseateles amylovorans]